MGQQSSIRPATASAILDVAQRLVQTRGYNGFSYADIAAELAITKAALHYHFATKAQLGEALVARYETSFADLLSAIDAGSADAVDRLASYVDVYRDVLQDQRICLCGMLAAEYQTLPGGMQAAVARFFAMNEVWLERVLEDGRAAGTLAFAGSGRETGRLFMAGLEGALLLSRATQDVAHFDATAEALVASVLPAGVQRPARSADAAPALESRAGHRGPIDDDDLDLSRAPVDPEHGHRHRVTGAVGA
jgi:TetR/AcrR family transcriptional repressor of nem operon